MRLHLQDLVVEDVVMLQRERSGGREILVRGLPSSYVSWRWRWGEDEVMEGKMRERRRSDAGVRAGGDRRV